MTASIGSKQLNIPIMKRILIPLMILFLSLPLAAQERFEVRIGWGGYPLMDESSFTDGYSKYPYGPIYIGLGDLEAIYMPQKDAVYMTGQIFGEFTWHVRKKLSISGGLYFNGIYGDIVDPDTNTPIRRARGLSATILPDIYWYWASYPKCRFYSGIGLGLHVGAYDGESLVNPALQFTPIGFTAGKKFFFFAEYGIGTLCMGGKAGFGYRF